MCKLCDIKIGEIAIDHDGLYEAAMNCINANGDINYLIHVSL